MLQRMCACLCVWVCGYVCVATGHRRLRTEDGVEADIEMARLEDTTIELDDDSGAEEEEKDGAQQGEYEEYVKRTALMNAESSKSAAARTNKVQTWPGAVDEKALDHQANPMQTQREIPHSIPTQDQGQEHTKGNGRDERDVEMAQNSQSLSPQLLSQSPSQSPRPHQLPPSGGYDLQAEVMPGGSRSPMTRTRRELSV